MGEILFKRTLHPVGHGAFFTEQFFSKEEGISSINVVYDCGSLHSRSASVPSVISNEIKISFDNDEHIDMVFISHFDNDHVNGLMGLLGEGRNKRMDSRTHVFIPFKYPYLILVMEDDYPEFCEFIRAGIKNGVHFIGVDIGDEVSYINIDDSKFIEGNGSLSFGISEKFINVFYLGNQIWHYMPFMRERSLNHVGDFYKRIKKELPDINLNNVEHILDNANFSSLKKIYKEIGHTENGVTRININSLLMLSFPSRDIQTEQTYIQNPFYKNWHGMDSPYSSIPPSCLYTGDTSLSSDLNIINHCVCELKKHSGDFKIGMMQIPHHGSKYCYNQNIASSQYVFSAFLNFLQKKNDNSSKIIADFSQNNKSVFLITKDCNSRFVLKIKINTNN